MIYNKISNNHDLDTISFLRVAYIFSILLYLIFGKPIDLILCFGSLYSVTTNHPYIMNSFPVRQYMPITEIEKDSSNLRNSVDPSHVSSIKEKILRGRFPDPPKVRYENGKYYCFDGMHRLTAYRELGYSSILVDIYQYDSKTAKEESYEANLGKNWTEAEKSKRFLDLYQEGRSEEEICKMYPDEGTKETIKKKIRFAYWLSPDILNLLGKGVTQKLADAFIDYEMNHQIAIYNVLRSNNWKGVDTNVCWIANRDNYHSVKRDIRQIPRNVVQRSPEPIPNPKIDVLQQHIDHLKNYIRGLALQYNVSEAEIKSRLV